MVAPAGIVTPLKRKPAIAGLSTPVLPTQIVLSDGMSEPVSFTSSAPLLICTVMVCVPVVDVAVAVAVAVDVFVAVGVGVSVLVRIGVVMGVFVAVDVFVGDDVGVFVTDPLEPMRP